MKFKIYIKKYGHYELGIVFCFFLVSFVFSLHTRSMLSFVIPVAYLVFRTFELISKKWKP